MPTAEAAPPDPYGRMSERAGRGVRVTVVAVLFSAALAAIKVIAGIVGNSYALVADGVESILDIISSIVVWGSLKLASSPPTERFPYGYGRVEPLAALVVATAMLVVAAGIAIQCVREILTPHHLPEAFTLYVLLAVVVIKEGIYRLLSRSGRSIRSTAMQVDAWHHRSDMLTSLAAFIGIAIARLAGPSYAAADDWAALFACAVISFNGVRLFRSALSEALDVALPAEVEDGIRQSAGAVPGVAAIDKCEIRKSGLGMFCTIHVVVDGEIPVRAGHEIAHRVKDALLESDLGLLDVVVHIEPAEAA